MPNQAIDFQGVMNEYLCDEKRKIPQTHLDCVCKKNIKGACRYICLVPQGYVCTKKTPIKESLDKMVIENKMSAKGDNCEGLGDYIKK